MSESLAAGGVTLMVPDGETSDFPLVLPPTLKSETVLSTAQGLVPDSALGLDFAMDADYAADSEVALDSEIESETRRVRFLRRGFSDLKPARIFLIFAAGMTVGAAMFFLLEKISH